MDCEGERKQKKTKKNNLHKVVCVGAFDAAAEQSAVKSGGRRREKGKDGGSQREEDDKTGRDTRGDEVRGGREGREWQVCQSGLLIG